MDKVIHWGLCEKFKQKIYAQPRIYPREGDAQTPLGFWDKNSSPNIGHMTRPYYNHRKKRTRRIVDFAVPTDHRVKLKESEKKNKYYVLAREFKKLWNMKVPVMPIVVGTLSTVTKGFVKGLEDWRTWT